MSPNATREPVEKARPLRPAQARVVEAALKLFTEHGLSGTSLQMIADAVGVTKAAIYHQFKTKEEIVLAVAAEPLRTLRATLDAAEAAPSRAVALELLLNGFVALAVDNREVVSMMQGDPAMIRFCAEHEELQELLDRIDRLMMGDETSDLARVRTAMVTCALGGALVHPLVADLDDATVRRHLLDLSRRLFDGLA